MYSCYWRKKDTARHQALPSTLPPACQLTREINFSTCISHCRVAPHLPLFAHMVVLLKSVLKSFEHFEPIFVRLGVVVHQGSPLIHVTTPNRNELGTFSVKPQSKGVQQPGCHGEGAAVKDTVALYVRLSWFICS